MDLCLFTVASRSLFFVEVHACETEEPAKCWVMDLCLFTVASRSLFFVEVHACETEEPAKCWDRPLGVIALLPNCVWICISGAVPWRGVPRNPLCHGRLDDSPRGQGGCGNPKTFIFVVFVHPRVFVRVSIREGFSFWVWLIYSRRCWPSRPDPLFSLFFLASVFFYLLGFVLSS